MRPPALVIVEGEVLLYDRFGDVGDEPERCGREAKYSSSRSKKASWLVSVYMRHCEVWRPHHHRFHPSRAIEAALSGFLGHEKVNQDDNVC